MRVPRFPTSAGTVVRGLILAAAVSLWVAASPVRADEMGMSAGGLHAQPQPPPMVPRFGPGIVPPFGSSPVPPLGPNIVPPLGPDIVPPLVSGPCCQGDFDHHRRHRFPFPVFGVVTQTYSLPPVAAQPLPAPGSVLPPPPPDFEPRLVTLKPLAARPGDPAAVVVMRAGEPQEVVKFKETETR